VFWVVAVEAFIKAMAIRHLWSVKRLDVVYVCGGFCLSLLTTLLSTNKQVQSPSISELN